MKNPFPPRLPLKKNENVKLSCPPNPCYYPLKCTYEVLTLNDPLKGASCGTFFFKKNLCRWVDNPQGDSKFEFAGKNIASMQLFDFEGNKYFL